MKHMKHMDETHEHLKYVKHTVAKGSSTWNWMQTWSLMPHSDAEGGASPRALAVIAAGE
jgi:hypothetical protein